METAPRTLMVFVDGLGLGSTDPEVNPIYRGACPHLAGWLTESAASVDARLDMEGKPQSATGQAALYSGRNAAAVMGRHKEGFPGPVLKDLLLDRNIFDLLLSRGYACAFANAYYLKGPRPPWGRRQSVTTVMTLKALGGVRTEQHLARGEAVYNDLTREHLVKRGWDGSVIMPEDAGRDLVNLAERYDFTLFEYFLTDLSAHKGTPEELQRILGQLDRFLSIVSAFGDTDRNLFVLISDHGNVEDVTTRTHTLNPVPLVAEGRGAGRLRARVRSLVDVVPALLDLYPPRPADAPERAGPTDDLHPFWE